MNKINWAEREAPCGGVLEDCGRIQRALSVHYIIDLSEALMLWRAYSEDKEAGWMSLPDSNDKLREWLMDFIYE